MDRRSFLVAATTLMSGMPLNASAAAATPDDYSGPLPDLALLGTDPPTSAEVAKAIALVAAAPKGPKPVDLARYFETIKDTNGDGELYNAGWKDRWNPLIVTFFQATKTQPSGDVTPWCAAFLNWMLMRCGLDRTKSASSGSFRNWATMTDKPEVGDIVVFARTDPAEAKRGKGHVGLFLREEQGRILVLGGNQITDTKHHVINSKWLSKKGRVLVFHSYRSVASIKPIKL